MMGVTKMHIGLIGGIGPGAKDYYYRRLISTFARKNATLELTIVHADTPTLLRNLASNDAAAQTAIYERLTNRLVSAGAECVGVTSIAGHFCIDAFKAVSSLPLVDMISEVSRALETRGLKRIGILGTYRDGDPLLWAHYQCRDHSAKRAGLGRCASSLHFDGRDRYRD